MTSDSIRWPLYLLLFAACGETNTCPAGTHYPRLSDGTLGATCVAIDAGTGDAGGDASDAAPDAALDTGADSAIDAAPDAGPCGGPCASPTPLCDEAAGTCVACLVDADCTELAAARCAGGACAPCTASGSCAGRAGTEVCEPSGGSCVECTAAEAGACLANPCTALYTCSAYGSGAQRTCEPCDTDASCEDAAARCVPMRYLGADRPDGYCLTDAAAGGCAQPFSISIAGRTSLSGEGGLTYCGIDEGRASCEAVRALLDNIMCPGGTDAECPGPGGLCRRVGALTNRCTYPCGAPVQCDDPPNPGSTCGDGGSAGAEYCGG